MTPLKPHCRDERVSALRRLDGRALGLVKRGEMIFQDVRDGFVLAQPRRLVQRANKQRLRDCAVGLFLDGELDGIALRLLQNQPRNVEQRIRAAGHLDLTGQRLDAVFIRQKRDADFRQRRRRFRPLTAFVTTIIAATEAAFAVAKLGAAARRAASAPAFATAAKTTATFAARTAAFAGFAAEAAFGLHALVAGEFVKAVGLGFPLRPRRLKQLVKVQSEIGNSIHVKSNQTPRHAETRINHSMERRGVESNRF